MTKCNRLEIYTNKVIEQLNKSDVQAKPIPVTFMLLIQSTSYYQMF